ncbi:UNVERIFIED_CONTAM: movement protein [Sesamum radiatum]|uniref:Movement protein n=1 Tax=Sesamum radiatum TaxID=300843 RepID=A0AAW2PIH8_SESRA
MEVTRADLSDPQELAESFFQLGIVELVNVQTNEITPALPPPEGSTGSNDPSQDHPMREGTDFHTNATPMFVGIRFKENLGRNSRRVPENTPWARTMLQPLHPYGTILNLDIIDFKNTEKLIDEWVAALKIAATTLELDRENFIRLVELSLEGSVKIGWDNTPEDTKVNILTGDSKSAIAEQLGRLIKIHFIGDGYFEGSRENLASQGRGKRVATPTLGVPDEPLSNENHGGPNPRPEPTNLDRGPDQRGLHPKDLDEQMRDPQDEPLLEELSDEPIPEPIKVSKTAIAGPAKQRVTYLQTARRNVVNYVNLKSRMISLMHSIWILNDGTKQNRGRIMRQDSNLSPYDGFRIGGIGKVLNQIGLNEETSHHLQRKLMFDIHPRIAYNLADQDFSRILTFHQDFKRKDLMKEENRPYSITYKIAYALSNTHHFDLFLRKEYIEIPRIFKKFVKVMTPDPIRIPRIGGVDIVIKDHPVLERTH